MSEQQGVSLVELTGSNVLVKDYNTVVNIPNLSGFQITLNPPSGKRWNVKGITLNIPSQAGATGAYQFYFDNGVGSPRNIDMTVLGSNPIDIKSYTRVGTVNSSYPTDAYLLEAIKSMISNTSIPLRFYLYNNTGVTITGNITLKLTVEEVSA